MTPNILYFSLYLVPECDISYIPPPSPSTPFHPTLTHLSIINFRVPPSFLALFPLLIEVTVTLLLTPAQNELVQLQYCPKDVQALLLSLPPVTVKRITMSCTHLPVEILALTAQRFPNLTHLSFVWVDAPDRMSGGVESTDITHCIRQYAEAIAPLSNTLQALYLPACVGVTTAKGSNLPAEDELLGEGPVLLPASDSLDNPLHGGMGSIGFMGVNHQPLKHGRVSVGMKGLLDACRTLVKGVGPVRTVNGEIVGTNGMWALEKIGWLIPQGDEQPLLPIECLRRKGVVKFGAASNSSQAAANLISNGVRMMSISGDTPVRNSSSTAASGPFMTPFSTATYTPNSHRAMTVPITYGGGHDLVRPSMTHSMGYFSTSSLSMATDTSTSSFNTPKTPTVGPTYKEETEYWYPSMEWSDDCAWPAFAEIEAVFPRPACMRY